MYRRLWRGGSSGSHSSRALLLLLLRHGRKQQHHHQLLTTTYCPRNYSYSPIVMTNNNINKSSSCLFLKNRTMQPTGSSFTDLILRSHLVAAQNHHRTFATTASSSTSTRMVVERQEEGTTKSDDDAATTTLDDDDDMDNKERIKCLQAAARRRKRQRAIHKRWSKRRLQRLEKEITQIQLVRHDKTAFKNLFDQLARQHSLKTLMDVLQQIVAKTKATSTTTSPNTAMPSSSSSSLTILLGMLHVTNPNNVPRLAMLELLLSTSRRPVKHKKSSAAAAATTASSSSLLPNSIKKKLDNDEEDDDVVDSDRTILMDHAVETFLKARERALHQQLCWSHADANSSKKKRQALQQQRIDQYKRKTHDKLQKEARELVRFLSETLPAKHYQSTLRLFEYYVGNDDDDDDGAASSRTTLDVDNDVDDDKTEPTVNQEGDNNDNDNDNNTPSPPRRSKNTTKTSSSSSSSPVMRKLSRNLEQRTGVHYCQVAPQVAEFFDFDVKDDVVVYDARFRKAQEKWAASKEKFVNTMMDLQEKIFEQVEKDDAEELDVTAAASSSDVNDDADRALRESEDRLNLAPSSRVVLSKGNNNKTKKHDRRFRRPAHVVFEAMVLHEAVTTDLNNHHVSSSSSSSPAQNKVFIDNLPIDITVSEITDLYSRCGDLSSIEIFNQRPDLDPGELSLTKRRERRKKQHRNVSPIFRKWQRRRTPVYALLTFADAEGYRVCTGTELKIFGMIVRKHPVRSIPATDMTSLYVEGIPEGSPCIDFEYQLSQQLNPDLLVCLDSGQNKRVIVGSCEIKFPSFELALDSYSKLEGGGLDNVDGVHWMRTPKDAEQWWTRKKGFD